MSSKRKEIQIPLSVEELTITIELTKGYSTIIDSIDYDLFIDKCQVTFSNTSGPYASRGMMTKTGRRPVKLHRLIMERILSRELNPQENIDHINGDTLDNRRCNLRLADKKQNAMNAKRRSDNLSGYKGVCFHPFSGLWRSYITVNKKQISLGYYKTPEEAHEAYKIAAKEHYGEFARFE